MQFKFLNIKKARAEVNRLASELSGLTGKPVSAPPQTVNISKANRQVEALAAELQAAKHSHGTPAPISMTAPSVAAQPLAPVSISNTATPTAPALTGARLRAVARLFPNLDAQTFGTESELFDAVERESHKSGLQVPGQRDTTLLTVLHGPTAPLASAQSRALQSLRQAAIDDIAASQASAAVATPRLLQATPPVAPAAGPWNVESLSVLTDAIFGKGTAKTVLATPLEIDVSGNSMAARANAVQHNAWQSELVRDEVKRRLLAKHAAAAGPAAQAAAVATLKDFLFHAGVQHPALDFTGVTPDENRIERDARKVAIAQRKAAAFLGVLNGTVTNAASAADLQAVESAKAYMQKKTGKAYCIGQTLAPDKTFAERDAAKYPFSNIPK